MHGSRSNQPSCSFSSKIWRVGSAVVEHPLAGQRRQRAQHNGCCERCCARDLRKRVFQASAPGNEQTYHCSSSTNIHEQYGTLRYHSVGCDAGCIRVARCAECNWGHRKQDSWAYHRSAAACSHTALLSTKLCARGRAHSDSPSLSRPAQPDTAFVIYNYFANATQCKVCKQRHPTRSSPGHNELNS